jgi:hypothetical protein
VGETTAGDANNSAPSFGCPGERQNGTLRFTVGRSTLTPKGFIASHAGMSALVYVKRT